ncbi:hypothetical protein [Streptomyces clavuligerus]|uniref:hypothetical protein n=1 Tax=Streptomyces clavuligerus TaxID=1901 RepID=UPI00017FF694|nr:hypothetical protein [Streptomyces clavuligerus]EDY49267.1 hypothetical protein SSCG_02295 [Streptomyces clavuligerus]WDN56169.1 hypothetical protein LL058_30400 [Streptomyces clavuligerus]
MGAIENHEALMYGYRLGGPADDWEGLKNELVQYTDEYDSSPFQIPKVSWETEDMRASKDGDFFAEAAEKRLKAHGLEALSMRTYSIGWEDEGHILAASVIEPRNGPLSVDATAVAAASQYDERLKLALYALELRPRASKPEWIMASYYA